jgi:hypothetical protein
MQARKMRGASDLPVGRVLLLRDLRDGHFRAPELVCEKSNFALPFKLIRAVQSCAQKFFVFYFSENNDYLRRPGPKEGVSRTSHTLGR